MRLPFAPAALVCTLALLSAGCSPLDLLPMQPVASRIGAREIVWGGSTPYMEGRIVSLNVEFFEAERRERGGQTYDVAATALTTMSIRDSSMWNAIRPVHGSARMTFSLVSTRGVILRQQVADGSIGEPFCTRFAGLSRGELRKVAYLGVSWVYGPLMP